jgi:hypothetical protein
MEHQRPSNWRQILNSNKGPLDVIEKLSSWGPDTANEQIEVRYKLLRQMVGSLYPQIVLAEIERITEYIRNDYKIPTEPDKPGECTEGAGI